jgi:hypothetical protein
VVGGDCQVAADEEGQPTEHPFLRQVRLATDHLSDAVGQVLVVDHRPENTRVEAV